MASNFNKLFQVTIKHHYFGDLPFTGFNILPTKECRSILSDFGLVLKPNVDGFMVFFAATLNGTTQTRDSVLKNGFTLGFTLQITDPLFYTYTANLPSDFRKKAIWLSNFDDNQQDYRKSDLLHVSEYVSESDIKPSLDPLNHGQIDIWCDEQLKESFHICFLNNSKHWKYIIVGEQLHQLEKLAILDQTAQKVFSAPEKVQLPDGKTGLSFASKQPIAVYQKYNEFYQLVSNYDELTNHFDKKLIGKLPTPSLSIHSDYFEMIVYL
ncbi:MAG TPA: hypothetical protein PLY70_15730 [Saprospiraceae bacterium]|nr:hypothetical protein [Saprospiraceae bacterium]